MSNKISAIKDKLEEKNQASTMTVTLDQLASSNDALLALISQPLPIREAFNLGKLARAIRLELTQFEETRQSICERHALKDDEGKVKYLEIEGRNQFEIPPAHFKDFETDMQSLLLTEVSLPFTKVKISTLEGRDINLPPSQTMQLEWLLEE